MSVRICQNNLAETTIPAPNILSGGKFKINTDEVMFKLEILKIKIAS